MENPFKKADTMSKNVKLLVYGDSGVGKTTLALQFPKPCVIDLEGGTELYGSKFKFDVFRAKNCKETTDAISYLLNGGSANYETVIIDPITVYWEQMQRKWSDILLRRNKDSKGYKHEFYDFQPRDWSTIKSDWKECISNLIALPLNVVAIAREKPEYADTGFMQKIGKTFDGEKSLPYLFDTVVHLVFQGNTRVCRVTKDRSETLTDEFQLSYEPFSNIINGVRVSLEDQIAKLESDEIWFYKDNVPFKLTFVAEDGESTGQVTWDVLYERHTCDVRIKTKDGIALSVMSYLEKLTEIDNKKYPLLPHQARHALNVFKERDEKLVPST